MVQNNIKKKIIYKFNNCNSNVKQLMSLQTRLKNCQNKNNLIKIIKLNNLLVNELVVELKKKLKLNSHIT